VGEVVDWLQSPAADGLTTAEAAILLVIAERAHDKTREMWRHRIDDHSLYERIKRAARLSDAGLSKALQRLAKRGLECRVPIGTDKRGRPVYAARGRSMAFRLPELPASVTLPDPVETTPDPVDNPPSEPVENPPPAEERSDQDPTFTRKVGPQSGLSGRKVGRTSAPNTSRENPSKRDPSSHYMSSHLNVEDPPSRAETEKDDQEGLTYADASARLQRLPDLGAALLTRIAQDHPDTDYAQRVIIAAQLLDKETA